MKKLVIQSYERTRYDYVLELNEEYVNETNEWLRKYHKQVNSEDVPFLDAEMLVDIWNNGGNLKLINIDREQRGQKPIENIKIVDLRYPSDNINDLFYYVYDLLLDDVWYCDGELVDSEVDDYDRKVEETE